MPLDWIEDIADVPARGLERERIASPAELADLATRLGVLSCERVAVRYRVVARPGGCYVLDGTLEADVTRECVVSLEPVAEHIGGRLSVDFEPDAARAETEAGGGTIDPFTETEIEPIENGRLAVGRIVEEEIASRLDPYPRHPDAKLEQPTAGGDGRDNPFAGLADLKKRLEGGG